MARQHRVEVRVSGDRSELVADELWQLGATAISEAQRADQTVLIVAGFDGETQAEAAAERLAEFDPVVLSDDPLAWVDTWRAGQDPVRAGGFVIRLPEHETPVASVATTTPGDMVIEPADTFGFGHVSTQLALELMAPLPVSGRTVADIGCGSGILAIAAALRGAAQVHAVDISQTAVEATRANAAINNVSVDVRLGSVEALPRGASNSAPFYNIALLNVTAGTAVLLAPAVLSLLGPDGMLVVSGLLATQRDAVLGAFSPLQVAATQNDNEWCALLLTAPNPKLRS